MIEKTLSLILELEKLLGINIYLVGGAVRDLLLGLPTKDYDFTTDSSPDEIEQAISNAGFKPYLMGKRFGTIGFKFQGEYIEITTFRNESYTYGSRKPQVQFHSDLKSDLARRDFTVNAMALTSKGKLIDYFDGESDLKNSIIRTVGVADQRFEEDALRMLRAIRFAAQYEFKIEEQTFKSIQKNYLMLLNISIERWVMELDKILSLEKVDFGLDYLLESGLLGVIIPEITLFNLPYIVENLNLNLWSLLKQNLISISKEDLNQRWAVLLGYSAYVFTITNQLQLDKFGQTKTGLNDKFYENIKKLEFKKYTVQQALKYTKYLKFSNQRQESIQATLEQIDILI